MKKSVDKETNFDGGGKNRITVGGLYHLIIDGPSEGIEQDDRAVVECKVIGAADPTQLDKTLQYQVDFEVRFPSDDAEKLKKQHHMVDGAIAQFTSALALTEMSRGEVATMEQWRGWIGNDVEFNFEQSDGRQFVAEVEMDEFEGKDRETGQPTGEMIKVPKIKKYWTIYGPLDVKAAKYPLNAQYVELLGGDTQQQTPPPATPDVGDADPWAAFE